MAYRCNCFPDEISLGYWYLIPRGVIMKSFKSITPYTYGMLASAFSGAGLAGVICSLYALSVGHHYTVPIIIGTIIALGIAAILEVASMEALRKEKETEEHKNEID